MDLGRLTCNAMARSMAFGPLGLYTYQMDVPIPAGRSSGDIVTVWGEHMGFYMADACWPRLHPDYADILPKRKVDRASPWACIQGAYLPLLKRCCWCFILAVILRADLRRIYVP